MSPLDSSPLERFARALESAGVAYAIIGGHAVNAWLEPRFTADVDVTVGATPEELSRLHAALASDGFSLVKEYGAELPSGPDFVRWRSDAGDVLEIQIAKTALQHEVVRRAVTTASGVRVATKEDLIVLKLIADRAKDRVDLLGLCTLDGNDWEYIEHRASEWDVSDRLRRYRKAP